MLDQLVESKNYNKENRFKNVLLMGTLALVLGGFISALGYSLFTQDLFVGGDGLELSTLVAPIPEEAPPPPEEKEPEKQEAAKINADMRKELIANILDSPPKVVDKAVATKQDFQQMRKDTPTVKGSNNSNAFDDAKNRPSNEDLNRGGDFKVGGDGDGKGNADSGREQPTPRPPADAPPPPPPPPPPPKVPSRISGGVVNGKATSLPKPAYPAAARAANIKGSVNVAIVISKSGSVMSASAVSGHPLLRAAAVSAARNARFAPTMLSGQAVEVSGVIVYNFQ